MMSSLDTFQATRRTQIACVLIVLVASSIGAEASHSYMASPDAGNSLSQKGGMSIGTVQFAPVELLRKLDELDENELLTGEYPNRPEEEEEEEDEADCNAKEPAKRVGMRSSVKAEVRSLGFFPEDRSYMILFGEFLVLLALVAAFDHLRFWIWPGKEDAKVAKKVTKQRDKAANTQDTWGITALHNAAAAASVTTLTQLLDGGADVFARDAWDETPLHFAARAGSVECCEFLVARGADVNAANMDEHTPLLIAGSGNKEAVCEFLLEHEGHAGGATDTDLPPLVSALLMARMFAK